MEHVHLGIEYLQEDQALPGGNQHSGYHGGCCYTESIQEFCVTFRYDPEIGVRSFFFHNYDGYLLLGKNYAGTLYWDRTVYVPRLPDPPAVFPHLSDAQRYVFLMGLRAQFNFDGTSEC